MVEEAREDGRQEAERVHVEVREDERKRAEQLSMCPVMTTATVYSVSSGDLAPGQASPLQPRAEWQDGRLLMVLPSCRSHRNTSRAQNRPNMHRDDAARRLGPTSPPQKLPAQSPEPRL